MTANELKTYTEKELNAAGWHVFRVNAGYGGRWNTRLAPTGTPDIIGYDPNGAYVGFEIKIEGDDWEDGQREELKKIHNTKYGRADVIRCKEDVNAIIEIWPDQVPDAEILFDKGTTV
jgi:hypothetical protein